MDRVSMLDDYYNSLSVENKQTFDELRSLFFKLIPGCLEKFSWGMPTYSNGKNIIHFYFHKNHIGIYPGSEAISHFSDELISLGYKFSKGAFQVPYDKELPLELITNMINYNVRMYGGNL